MEVPRGAARENVSRIAQELSSSTQVALETYAEDKKQGMGNTEVKDCVGTHELLQETGVRPLMVTPEQLGTPDSTGTSADRDQNPSINADTWQKYSLKYTNADNCQREESHVSFKREADKHQDFKKHSLCTQYINVTEEIERGSHFKDISESTFNEIESGLLLSSTGKSMKLEDIAQDDTLCITDHTLPYKHESDRVDLRDFKKQGSYSEQANETEEIECESLDMFDSTFNVNGSGPLSSTMNLENIAQDDTRCITDLIPPCDHTQFSPECKESEPALKVTENKNTSNKGNLEGKPLQKALRQLHIYTKSLSPLEETEANKSTTEMENLDKLGKSMNEEIAWLKGFLSEAVLVEIPSRFESKPLQKTLRHLHSLRKTLNSENLHCQEQINRLRTEKTSLHIQLSIAEQNAKAHRQHSKTLNDKCEELLTQRKQIQDERDHLSFQMQLLTKEIERLREENMLLLKDLSAADTEKERLIKKLDSSKKMTLSYCKEKQEIHRKWNEALMENYHLKKNAEEFRTQHLKDTGGLPLMVTSEQLGTPDSTGTSSDRDQNPSINADTCKNYNLKYTNTDNCKQGESNVSFESEGVKLRDIKKQGAYNENANGTEEIKCGSLGMSDSTFNGAMSSTAKLGDITQDDTLRIVIPPCDHTQLSPECKESAQTLEETEANKSTSEMENLDKSVKSIHKEIAWLKGFLSEAVLVEVPSQIESKPLQKALRHLHILSKTLNSENLQCREQIHRLRTEEMSLHIQLSIAEQNAEAHRQRTKALTDKCEELLTQRKHIQDERDHLSFQMKLLIKEVERLREDEQMYLKDRSLTSTEKEELIKKLDSAQKMALSYGEQKHEILCKWNETLLENYQLRKQAEECRNQHETYKPYKWSIRVIYN